MLWGCIKIADISGLQAEPSCWQVGLAGQPLALTAFSKLVCNFMLAG